MDYCKLCGKSIKPYQLSNKTVSAATIFASSVNNSSNNGINPALGYGVTRGATNRSHLGCQKQLNKKGIWWTILGSILFIGGIGLLIGGSLQAIISGSSDSTVMIVFGIIFFILAVVPILIGMNIGKKYVREGNFQDDYIDEDEYKIYKAKLKRAEKEAEKIDE